MLTDNKNNMFRPWVLTSLKAIEQSIKAIYDWVLSVTEIVYKCYVHKFLKFIVTLWKTKLIQA